MKISKERRLAIARPFYQNQFFRLDDDGQGKPRYFDVVAMEEYAQGNLDVVALKAEPSLAAIMLKTGTVNPEYVFELTGKSKLAPILFCVGAGKDGGDLIVDGNHRYVAWTLAHHERRGDMRISAFLFEIEDWSQFVVPDDVVSQLGLFDPESGVPEGSQ